MYERKLCDTFRAVARENPRGQVFTLYYIGPITQGKDMVLLGKSHWILVFICSIVVADVV
jgi:hypothetical protein